MIKKERIMVKKRHVSFKIMGSYITNTAREFVANGKFAAAMELVMSCVESDDLTMREREHIAYDVINGNADIIGTYPDDDYGVEDYDEERKGSHIADSFEQLKTKCDRLEEEKGEALEKLCFILSYLNENSPYLAEEIAESFKEEYGYLLDKRYEHSSYKKQLVTEFLEQAKKDDNMEYGWLEPNGTYHPIEWAKHFEWAANYLKEHYPMKSYPELYWHEFPNQGKRPINGGDVLTYKLGWVCIHNPQQGRGQIEAIGKPMTKAQKEFMYQYYMERDRRAEATALWEDETNG